jgi:PKD repeat protein
MWLRGIITALIVCTLLAPALSSIPSGTPGEAGEERFYEGWDVRRDGPRPIQSPALLSGFVENRGQFEDERVLFHATTPGGAIALLENGALLNVKEPYLGPMAEGKDPVMGPRQELPSPILGSTVKVTFEGSQDVIPVGRDMLPGHINFFIGADSSRWSSGVPVFREVAYEGLYEGIDLVYRLDGAGVKYELVVHPEADPGEVSIAVEGHDALSPEVQGDLVISTMAGDIVDSGLVAFYRDAPDEIVGCDFETRGVAAYGFRIAPYDRTRTLVIDPLVYSTYLGNTEDEFVNCMATDPHGNVYIAGSTYSRNFPTTAGAYQTSMKGEGDAFVTKLSPDGRTLVYSTFLGGGVGEAVLAMDLDSAGNAYLVGFTTSANFPTTKGAYQEKGVSPGGPWSDGFLCKLASSGGSLVYSTFISSRFYDETRGVAVDGDGLAYITGYTSSSDFNTTPGAYQTTHGGLWDVYVAKLKADGSALVYSTFLGGNMEDVGEDIAVDGSGNAYVCGWTTSENYPNTTGAHKRVKDGRLDGFVTKVSADGASLGYSTYLGGSAGESAQALTLATNGSAHVTGVTYSNDFHTTRGAQQEAFGGGEYDAYVVHLSVDGSTLLRSTFLGGLDRDSGDDIHLDDDGNVLVCGYTLSNKFPTTEGAAQTTAGGTTDGFASRLRGDYSDLLYSTYLGGQDYDIATGIAAGGKWFATVVGSTASLDFPIKDAYQRQLSGTGRDGFISRLTFDLVVPTAEAGPDVVIDQHENVTFNATGSTDNLELVNWTWTFDYDGEPVRLYGETANFTFHTVGTYAVTLAVRDEAFLTGTDIMNVTVMDITPPVAVAGSNRTILQHETVTFDGGGSSDNVAVVNWTWTFTYLGEEVALYGPGPSFTFDEASTFEVLLNVSDGVGNWALDSMTVTVQDITLPVADAGEAIEIDQHETATLNGTGSTDNVGIVNWTWTFSYRMQLVFLYGPKPTYTFDDAGTYEVLLTVKDGIGNQATASVNVTVRDVTPPVADAGPDQTVEQGQTVDFDGSASSDNVVVAAWKWSFEYGGATRTLDGPDPEFIFEVVGQYTVTLTVEDAMGNPANDVLLVTVVDSVGPTADAGADIVADQHESVTLDGTASHDNVGIMSWTWEFEHNGQPIELQGETAQFTFEEAGVYTVVLTVVDTAGNDATDSITVTVRDITPPFVDAGEAVTVDQFTTVTLDASASSDNVGIVEWTWTFDYEGATQTLSGKIKVFKFDAPDVYTVLLKVLDAAGNENSTTFVVTVRDIVAPTAIAPIDMKVSEGEKVTLNGSASVDNVGIVKWLWTFEEDGRPVTLEGETVDHTFDEPGKYEVTLTVEDAEGNQGTKTFTVTVEEEEGFPFWMPVMVVLIALAVIFRKKLRPRRRE